MSKKTFLDSWTYNPIEDYATGLRDAIALANQALRGYASTTTLLDDAPRAPRLLGAAERLELARDAMAICDRIAPA